MTETSPAGFPLAFAAAADAAAPRAGAEALAEGIGATLRMAHAMVAAHRQVDLAGLDGMVGVLCAQALDLPPAEGVALRPRLAALIGELDALEEALAANAPP
jgi:hypothetical protein